MAAQNECVMLDDGRECRSTYYSLDEFAEAAERHGPSRKKWAAMGSANREWRGGTLAEVLDSCRNGWNELMPDSLLIAEEAVEMAVKHAEVSAFTAVHDYSGADVDIARYLSGDPENMIDYPLQQVARTGKVITLCANLCVSSAIEPESFIRRGQILAAFAIALTKLGHATELWIDLSVRHPRTKQVGSVRVLVKGTGDEIDPAKILFAYAHPGALRWLGFGCWHGFPSGYTDAHGYGQAFHGAKDLPEGTIYLPEIRSNSDILDVHEGLKDLLRQVGLLAE